MSDSEQCSNQGCKKIMIFFFKSKKSDLFDLNQIFLIQSIFLIFIENVDFCNKKHDIYQEDKKSWWFK